MRRCVQFYLCINLSVLGICLHFCHPGNSAVSLDCFWSSCTSCPTTKKWIH